MGTFVMHPNNSFRKPNKQTNIQFSRARSFGVLTVNGKTVPLLSHIPFQLSEDGCYLEAHLVRSNPIARLLALGQEVSQDAVMIVSGGDAYISPDWYEVENQVPTWNYVAVHIGGKLKLLQQDELRGILERLSKNMEDRLLPKPPWKLDKLDDEFFSKMSRQIVPIALNVSDIEGTWKLSQNKSSEARAGAIKGVHGAQIGCEVDEIAELMEQVKED